VQTNFLFDTSENDDSLEALHGLRYQPEFIDDSEESTLIEHIRTLQFREFEFHGYLGKRRIVSFGWRYEYTGRGELKKSEDIPDFLLGLRLRAASFAEIEAESLQQVLVTEYRSGAGIGWHRDKPVFDRVVGISLLGPCILRFRRRLVGEVKGQRGRAAWQRVNLFAQPRSAYLLEGPVRTEWEHSILRVNELRYSITFRSLTSEKRASHKAPSA
jgi:alkylated DNA repair dioxygenase AlkB